MLRLSGSPTQLRQTTYDEASRRTKNKLQLIANRSNEKRDWCWRIRRFGSRVTLTERSNSNISQLVGVVSIE